ncbi:bifunctional diaminohydroxyphosphoribosylaminopyrimidine deaminase/5-amino-6-(5-phosphoribosylamino)uracil reductase RibD [Thalassospira sp. MCCC 1A01428]|uniref:bifunctional diaminohydroxyphosphoribosylaminopyrimidine deaminase/5-amino-6-(5-phosphoribosylamino)uracil reductase RibD n=1 Tax=Thalassospira sp. MCCC 1A01428 TaxID=1470575 RepID=UPI000A1DAB0B|nr:bifunctional diaminohydroxyphosphoribosylaminopyrimidine deaminase/5-amino-6-(5-phosphoribosylamino)uracil reductase RibD [Thalassospira sp. MCCC 1A01428]OSQ42328.1 5-amino-6-(5-phosphoribosylamino)uracil reductase [Thalassospira sp. MCCC 1A01428]
MAGSSFSDDDRHFMRVALSLSRRGLGNVWPNPAVGCVLVSKSGNIVGRGWTKPGGRPHAERVALDQAGTNAAGATAYVTLEPCSHFGKSPPCVLGLIEGGVSRVVSALEDPDPRVSGRGHQMLQDAGISVDTGLMAEAARNHNAGFLSRIMHDRPLITLKLAGSLDGRSSLANGKSQWITGSRARQQGHWFRANHDAIMIGADTAIADNPDLRCRIAGRQNSSPVRIVLDRQAKVSAECILAQTADETPTWVVVDLQHLAKAREVFSKTAVKVLSARCIDGHFDLHNVLHILAEQGLTRVLVESGGRLAAALLQKQVVDRVVHFQAPGIIGADGKGIVGDMHLQDLTQMYRFSRHRVENVGQDLMISYEKITDKS